MRVYLASDHAGLSLKQHLVGWLDDHGHEPVDCGPAGFDPDDDYPVFVLRAAERVAADPGGAGIVIGGSGNGEAIAANKVAGVRSALAWSEETARLAREHNDANVVSIGARMHAADEATRFVQVFLETSFLAADRYARRIAMVDEYERAGELPSLPTGPPAGPAA